jgi:hypothetical protein
MKVNEIAEKVQNGAKFTINLQTRTLRLNGKLVEIEDADVFCRGLIEDPQCYTECLESLYQDYKYSVPSERSDSRRHNYFRALREKDLSSSHMMYGMPREETRFNIEVFVLCSLLCGLKWDESWGTWFWQSAKDKDLVLLREWFEPNGKEVCDEK